MSHVTNEIVMPRLDRDNAPGILSVSPGEELCGRRNELLLRVIDGLLPHSRRPVWIEFEWVWPRGFIVMCAIHGNADGGASWDNHAIGERKVFHDDAGHIFCVNPSWS